MATTMRPQLTHARFWAAQHGPVTVLVDGSDSAFTAVHWAAREALRHRAPLELVYLSAGSLWRLLANGPANDPVAIIAQVLAEADPEKELDVEIREITGRFLPGPIAAGSRMFVTPASAHRSRFGTSLVSTLTRHAPCPVIIVPQRAEPHRTPKRAASRVVVGIDGQPGSEDAVRAAFEEAAVRDASLLAVHTWTDFDFTTTLARDAGLSWEDVATGEHVVLSTRLAGWRSEYPSVRVTERVVRDHPANTLAALSGRADLLVVGTHARGVLGSLVFGSTSETLMHASKCPLMVVRSGLYAQNAQ